MSLTEADEDPLIGQTVDGRYRVTARLGAGGMGFVYLAEHAQLGRPLVLKRLRPELVSNEGTRERFMREAQAASRIQHPHVIAVSDFGVLPELGAYYAMERLEGTDLGAELGTVGAVSIERAVAIVEQCAEALAAAHAASIVHRDLKPENVFLTTRDGQPDFVKVLDFGLARVMDANRKLTETGQVIGTPRYMAPEQCRGEKVDARADVYSLALIFHEMVTGVQPYRGLSTYEILGKKMFEHVTAPSQMDPPVALPPPLEAWLMRCLEREAPLRPADGAEMADALHRVRVELGLPANPFAHLAEGARKSLPSVSVSTEEPAARAPIRSGTLERVAPKRSGSPKRSGAGGAVALIAGVVLGLVGVAVIGVALFVVVGRDGDVPAPDPVVVTPPAPGPGPEAPPVEPPAPSVPRVEVVSEPSGAEVLYEGALVGTTPLTVEVPSRIPDGAQVQIRLDGYEPRDITLSSGVPTAHVRLHPIE